MTGREVGTGGAFHEVPLVGFTTLAIAGAGVGAGHLLLAFLGWAPWIPPEGVLGPMCVLLLGGFLVSLAHLGRPLRSPLALIRAGKSPLSNEVLVVGGALGASLIAWFLPLGHPLEGPTAILAMVFCFLALPAFGLVYRIPSQLAWNGPVVAHPLVLGIGFGLTFLLDTLAEGVQARGELLVLLVLAMDGVLVWNRVWTLGRAQTMGSPAYPSLFRGRWAGFSARVVLGVLLPTVFLLRGRWDLTLLSLIINLASDRVLFYGLAVRATTEAEIGRVEAVLRRPVSSSRSG